VGGKTLLVLGERRAWEKENPPLMKKKGNRTLREKKWTSKLRSPDEGGGEDYNHSVGGERGFHEKKCPRALGKKKRRGDGTKKNWGGEGIKKTEKVTRSAITHPRFRGGKTIARGREREYLLSTGGGGKEERDEEKGRVNISQEFAQKRKSLWKRVKKGGGKGRSWG